jgi:hypothetical protein
MNYDEQMPPSAPLTDNFKTSEKIDNEFSLEKIDKQKLIGDCLYDY